MAKEIHPEARRLFSRVMNMSEGERESFLGELDEQIRCSIEALLEENVRVVDDLAEIAPTVLGMGIDEPGTSAISHIGAYRVIRKLGEGGMGAVYLAAQSEPVRREVAIKLIRSASPSRQILARFEAERQALALMKHQNIAQVFDAGTTGDGLPYFVMEYVDGTPITTYAESQRLSVKQRLVLFRQTCRAVQHAHQKGVIHRDIKPSNVMVGGVHPFIGMSS